MNLTFEVTLSSALGRAPSGGTISTVRRVGRTAAGKFIAQHIRERIQTKGLGAGGTKLKGYSTSPVTISKGLLKKRIPSGGFPKFYEDGYAEYRQEVGLQVDHFAFTNTGASFRGFQEDIGDAGASTPILIGFKNPKSHIAAMEAVERERPDMFDISKKELDAALNVYLDSVVKHIWNDVFEGATTKQSQKAKT